MRSILTFALALVLLSGEALSAGAQGKAARPFTCRVQLAEISVQSPRSRRTDTNFAAMSVQVGAATPRSVTRRLGNIGRGTKAVNMSLPQVAVDPKARLRIAWAVMNYGGDRAAALLEGLRKATENQTKDVSTDAWISQLSEAVPIDDDRSERCDGPVLAGSFEIAGADLIRQLRTGKPLRVTRRQSGIKAPSRCSVRSDYVVTLNIIEEPSSSAKPAAN